MTSVRTSVRFPLFRFVGPVCLCVISDSLT